jgi:hypothetical protein
MLVKLQRKTLIPAQIIGYALGIFTGITIVLIAFQFYSDVKPLLEGQTDVFKNNTAVISKNVSLFNNLSGRKLSFGEEDINNLEKQEFVEKVAKFNSAAFEIKAYTSGDENMPVFQSDLFFESIPDEYLDAVNEDWKWNQDQNFIPIIIPEDYLNLYNFGFAESQGLPVFSKNAIGQISFNIRITGNGQSADFKSRIVGFSGKINSILVPEDFLNWANEKYGTKEKKQPGRLMVEMKNPADDRIPVFFRENNYNISKEKLELGKLMFFFKTAFGFIFFIAMVISVLSVSFIFLSFRLIFEKNRDLILNLFNIGYSVKQISAFYQWVVSIITLIALVISMGVSFGIQSYYREKIVNLLDFESQQNYIFYVGCVVLILLLIIYNIILPASIRRITRRGQ